MNSKEIKKIRSNGEIKKVLSRGEVLWQGGLDLMSLPIGAKVVDPNTKYYGKPIVWLIADKNHSGYPSDSVTLISEKILCLKAFDAMEPKNPDEGRREMGNNRYKFSNILQWLNSDKADWYSPQHPYDEPPTKDRVYREWNSYYNEPGFLYSFSLNFKNAILATDFLIINDDEYDFVTIKIFLASVTEAGFYNQMAKETIFQIFKDAENRKAYPTAEAVSKSNYTSSGLNASSPWTWWLRTSDKRELGYSGCCVDDGTKSTGQAYFPNGIRPLCNVSAKANFFEEV